MRLVAGFVRIFNEYIHNAFEENMEGLDKFFRFRYTYY